MLRLPVFLTSALLGAGVGLWAAGSGLASSGTPLPAGVSGDFGFAFLVAGGEAGAMTPGAASEVQGGGPASEFEASEFEDGAMMTGDAVLEILGRSAVPAQAPGDSAYRDAELVAHLVDLSSGQVLQEVVAHCPTVDFETVGGALFEEQVSCGAIRYSYGVSERGIEIFADGKALMGYTLDKGVYRLNGVPFVIN